MNAAIGMFTVSHQGSLLTISPWLSKFLEVDENVDLGNIFYQELITRLIGFTQDPARAQAAIDIGINNVNDYPAINLKLGLDGQQQLLVFFFPGSPDLKYSWGGLILDRTREKSGFRQQLDMLRILSLDARKSSASLQGNLGALASNLDAWSGSITRDFVGTITAEVAALNKQLDQLLLFEESLDQFQFFPEIINLRELLDSVILSSHQLAGRFVWAVSDSNKPPAIQVDPSLTGIAFEYLLLEMEELIPPNTPIEISYKSTENGIRLSFIGNMPLTLPGISEELVRANSGQLNIHLHLVQKIFAAQGGEVIFINNPAEPNSGLRVDVSMPEAEILNETQRILTYHTRKGTDTKRVLVAESQPDYQVLMVDVLEEIGYRVDLAIEGNSALDMAQRINPDLIIVDRNLPGLDGILVTQGIRRWSTVPILMISARTGLDDLIHAFQIGVDDYLNKPFQVDELLARVEARLRRGSDSSSSFTPDTYSAGDVRINYSTRQVWIRSKLEDLTPIEYNILAYMSRHRRQVMPYEQIIERAWEGPEKGTRQGLFVHIRRLRDKIELDSKNPQIIQNKWGVGYIFSP